MKVEKNQLLANLKKKYGIETFVFPMSNVVVEERLNENDSCGGMELHVSPIVNNQCQDEKVFAYYEDLVFYKVIYIHIYIYILIFKYMMS